MNVQINLWSLLGTHKMTIKELSDKIGMSQAQLGAIKNGKTTKISFQTIGKFLEVFHCTPNDLFEITGSNGEKKEKL